MEHSSEREEGAGSAGFFLSRSQLGICGNTNPGMTDIAYRSDFAVEDFLGLAQRVWPRDHSLRDASAALQRTINIGAWDGSRLVGSVRILTDGYFFATIPDIFVDPEYERRGIGRRLMELALERAPRGKVAFGAQPQSVEFFECIGCERKLTGFVAARPLKAPDPSYDRQAVE